MTRLAIIIFTLSISAYAQTATNNTSKVSSPCSVAVAGNNNTIYLNNCAKYNKKTQADKLRYLKTRTSNLASLILEFSFAREGPMNSWMQQAIAQAILDSIHQNQDGANEFHARRRAWDEQTKREFNEKYWPEVISLENDLANAGVKDLSPIASAVAADSPRKIGLMLSVVASRIGKKPPFPRTLTSLEARAIFRGYGPGIMEIYSYVQDQNSAEIAQTLRDELERLGWKVNQKIFPLESREPLPQGILMVYPSADWTTEANPILPAFEACDLEIRYEIHTVPQPPSIFKIEIWPEGSGPRFKAPLLNP